MPNHFSVQKSYAHPVKIGFLVNPIAGMGGAVGLKGTDGEAIQREALERGARLVSPNRAREALVRIKESKLQLDFLTCSGEMGQQEMDSEGLAYKVVYNAPARTTRNDTLAAAREFQRHNVDLIMFAGGDGTARDVLEIAGTKTAILGIPTGVKMHSGVFALTPQHVHDILATFKRTGLTKEAEVMDVDEECFRKGIVRARLYGIARVPDDAEALQESKQSYGSGTSDEEAEEIGKYIADSMKNDVAYILGPGSTTMRIAEALGQKKTLLGVDVYLNKRLLLEDAQERQLLDVLNRQPDARIVVSPIGAQGFFLGRGNQQISPAVVRRVGIDKIEIVASPTKLRSTPQLRVDTGDRGLDASLVGTAKVVTGYKRKRVVTIR
jgi:predicted polyphosphate/ATP-dependent NAD kinase